MKRIKIFIKDYKYWILAVFIIIIMFVSTPYLNKRGEEWRLGILENGKYSIAEVISFRRETRSSHYRYIFYYKNKLYKSRSYYKGINLTINKNYFIVFDTISPSRNSLLLQRLSVPDSITEAPSEGWKELPIPVDKEEIRKFLEDY